MAVQLIGSSGNIANVDTLGDLYVVPAAVPAVSPPWTNTTSINSVANLLTSGGFEACAISINQTSTLTDGVVVFEGTYDGLHWQAVPSGQLLDPNTFTVLPSTYTLQANTNFLALLVTGSFQQTRIRLSTVISGTGSVTIYTTLLSHNPVNTGGVVTVTNFPTQPNVFKTGQFTASGNTALWTPVSGKSFRLLRYQVEVSSNASQVNGGVFTVSFQDQTSTTSFAHDVYVPSASLKLFASYNSGWIDLGSTGYLSANPNNVLNVNLSAGLNSGVVRVTACGIEQ
jgi:hypothetical protein